MTGLTAADIWRLDIFEGSEYRRDHVKPRILTHIGDEDGKVMLKARKFKQRPTSGAVVLEVSRLVNGISVNSSERR